MLPKPVIKPGDKVLKHQSKLFVSSLGVHGEPSNVPQYLDCIIVTTTERKDSVDSASEYII